MTFRITGLSPEPFQRLFGLPDDESGQAGRQTLCRRQAAGLSMPGRDARRRAGRDGAAAQPRLPAGRHALSRVARHLHAQGRAKPPLTAIDEVPAVMRARLLSLRAFDADGMMVDADVVDGAAVEPLIARLLANADRQLHPRPLRQAGLLFRPHRPGLTTSRFYGFRAVAGAAAADLVNLPRAHRPPLPRRSRDGCARAPPPSASRAASRCAPCRDRCRRRSPLSSAAAI